MPEPEEGFTDDALSRMLASIDHPVPALRANDVITRARIRSGRRSALLAAAAVILLASVATATVPGSYLRRYLQHLLDGRAPAATARQTVDAAASVAASRGIAFTPGPQVDVDFRTEQASGALQVRLADVSSVMLAQTGSRGEAHYALTPDGVLVDNGGSTASYSLVLPHALARARVRIAGRLVFSKDADSVSCTGSRVDTNGCVIEVGADRPTLRRGTAGQLHDRH
jgi:hypothetical protein